MKAFTRISSRNVEDTARKTDRKGREDEQKMEKEKKKEKEKEKRNRK